MAKMTSRQRKNLPSSDFAMPAQRQYPIQDKAHARNALSRVAQNGTPGQQATVRAKVAKKYPSIGKKSANRKSM
jgi:hypothetical protein